MNLPRRRQAGTPSNTPPEPLPEDAWRTLSLMVDWIKHAESKATATLASAGVAGGVLYTLVSSAHRRSVAFAVVATACVIAITSAAVMAGVALYPRLGRRRAPAGLIFYREITDGFGTDAAAFAAAFAALAADRHSLFMALTQQVWANAKVATRKYRVLNFGIAALLPALVLLAVTAVLSLLSR